MNALTVVALLGLLRSAVAQQPAPAPAMQQIGSLGPGAWSGFAASPDARLVLYASGDGAAHLLDRMSGRTRRLEARGSNFAWSPRGNQIASINMDSTGSSRIALLEFDSTGTAAPRAQLLPDPVASAAAYSPDALQLAAVAPDPLGYAIVVIDLATRRARTLVRGRGSAELPQWSADGSALLWLERPVCCEDAVILRAAVADSVAFAQSRVRDYVGRSADGRLALLRASQDREYRVANEDGVAIASLELPTGFRPVGWLGSEPKLIAVREHATATLQLSRPDGAISSSGSGAGRDGPAAWSHDEKRLAFTSLIGDHRQLVLAGAAGGARQHLPTEIDPDALPPAWSADGRYLAVPARDGATMLVFDTVTYATVELRPPQGKIGAWRFSATNALLYAVRTGDQVTVLRQVIGTGPHVVSTLADSTGADLFLTEEYLVLRTDTEVVRVPFASGQSERLLRLRNGERFDQGVKSHGFGERIPSVVLRGGTREARLLNVATGRAAPLPTRFDGELSALAVSATGRVAATIVQRVETELWEVDLSRLLAGWRQ